MGAGPCSALHRVGQGLVLHCWESGFAEVSVSRVGWGWALFWGYRRVGVGPCSSLLGLSMPRICRRSLNE